MLTTRTKNPNITKIDNKKVNNNNNNNNIQKNVIGWTCSRNGGLKHPRNVMQGQMLGERV